MTRAAWASLVLLLSMLTGPAAAELSHGQLEQLLGEAATAYDQGIEQRRRKPAAAKASSTRGSRPASWGGRSCTIAARRC